MPALRWVAFAAAAMLAGCGQGGSDTDDADKAPAQAAAAPDACSLVTKADAEAAIGATVTGPDTSSGMGTMDQCQYLWSGEGLTDQGAVTVQVEAIDFASKRKAFVDGGEAIEPLTGIGEAAFWVPGHSALYVGKGKVTASFSVTRQGIDMKAASRALAEKGVARLP